jgi:hypothetical protein
MTGVIGSGSSCDVAEGILLMAVETSPALPGTDVATVSGPARIRTWGSRSALAAGIGVGRVLVGVSFLSSPVAGLRLIGLDTATAARVTWLTRTAGIRDVALGAGMLFAAATGGDDGPWLIAGAGCDAVDAAVTAIAARDGRVARVRGMLVAAGAAATALVATAALILPRRRPS